MDSVHGTRDVARQVQYLLDVDRLIKFFLFTILDLKMLYKL